MKPCSRWRAKQSWAINIKGKIQSRDVKLFKSQLFELNQKWAWVEIPHLKLEINDGPKHSVHNLNPYWLQWFVGFFDG
jgi:hypothetical protein